MAGCKSGSSESSVAAVDGNRPGPSGGFTFDDGDVSALLALAGDQSRPGSERAEAISDLACCAEAQDRSVVEALLRLTVDPCQEVSLASLEVLAVTGSPDTVVDQDLLGLLGADSGEVRAGAAFVAGSVGIKSPAIRDALLAELARHDCADEEAVAFALGQVGDHETSLALSRQLAASQDRALPILFALREIGDGHSDVLAVVQAVATNADDRSVRAAAFATLTKITPGKSCGSCGG